MPELAATPTPAAAPAGAAPSKPSTPAAAAPQPDGGSYKTEFDELDQIASGSKAKPAEKVEGEDEIPGADKPKEGDKPPGKEGEQKPADQKPEPEKIGKAAELRKAYEESKGRIKQLETEISEYKSGKSKVEDPELPKIRETLSQREKRLQELENEIKYVNYEKSQEYLDKHEVPIKNAFSSAYSDLRELLVADGSGETREAKPEDFDALLRMDLKEAATKSKEMFGDAATEVMAHRRKIIDMMRQRRQAVEDFRKQGDEREKQAIEQTRQQQESLTRLWDGINADLPKRYPEWFAPKEGDKVGNEFLDKGFELADKAFHGIGKIPHEELAQVQAVVRNRAAAFGRVAHQLQQANATIASLQKELDAFRKSGPGGGEVPTGGSKGAELSADDELDQIAGLRK
jgi:hypothetical protein